MDHYSPNTHFEILQSLLDSRDLPHMIDKSHTCVRHNGTSRNVNQLIDRPNNRGEIDNLHRSAFI